MRPPRPVTQAGGTILIVDDNREITEGLSWLLRARGHDVEVAHDGPGALEVAGRRPIRVAIIDIGLPGMDGYALAHRLRRSPRSASVTLVALTGYAQPSDRQRALKAGFSEHFAKPIDLERLVASVENGETST